ncbi:MAG: DUF1963 domain-containing protein [Paludibacteraceae bacterium]|nr:DUF1963 domain-containing protein [Paludibacteraceae bacterium]
MMTGIVNTSKFFCTQKNLKRRYFSKVLNNWDCG